MRSEAPLADFTIAAHEHDLLGEVPLWCERTSRLWWVDVMRCALCSLDPASGKVVTRTTEGHRLGSIALREQGGLLLATAEGIDVYDPATGTQKALTGRDRLGDGQRFNDGRCDRQGRFWVGTMNEDFRPEGTLYRLEHNGTLSEVFGGIVVPNSIAFSPDSRTLYFADTRRFTIWSFAFDAASGTVSNQKVFAQTTGRAGRPDGSCVDSEGFLWNAEYAGGQIVRYAPDGRIDRSIALPVSHPTSLCFGGPSLDTLYITSGSYALTPEQAAREPLAGAVIAIRPGVKGLPEPRFAG